MEVNFGDARHPARKKIFETRLSCAGDRDCVAVAAETRRDPKNVDLFDRGRRKISVCEDLAAALA